MGLAVVEQGGKGREVDAVGLEVHGLNSRDGTPEVRIDASGVDPGIDGCDAGGSAIDSDFGLTESGAGAALEFSGDVVGDAGIPEFVVGLALGEDVEIEIRDVGGKGQGLLKKIGGGVESDGAAGGTSGESDDLIGGAGRSLALRQRIEEDVGGSVEDAGVGLIDHVAEIDGSGLCDGKDGTVVGEVAFDVPVAGYVVRGLGGGAKINVGGADPDVGGAVELASLIDGEVGF